MLRRMRKKKWMRLLKAEEDEEVWKKKFEGLEKRVACIDSGRAVRRACIDK